MKKVVPLLGELRADFFRLKVNNAKCRVAIRTRWVAGVDLWRTREIPHRELAEFRNDYCSGEVVLTRGAIRVQPGTRVVESCHNYPPNEKFFNVRGEAGPPDGRAERKMKRQCSAAGRWASPRLRGERGCAASCARFGRHRTIRKRISHRIAIQAPLHRSGCMSAKEANLTTELPLLLALSVLWGASYSFIKVGVETIPPVTLIATRAMIAGAVLVLVIW